MYLVEQVWDPWFKVVFKRPSHRLSLAWIPATRKGGARGVFKFTTNRKTLRRNLLMITDCTTWSFPHCSNVILIWTGILNAHIFQDCITHTFSCGVLSDTIYDTKNSNMHKPLYRKKVSECHFAQDNGRWGCEYPIIHVADPALHARHMTHFTDNHCTQIPALGFLCRQTTSLLLLG